MTRCRVDVSPTDVSPTENSWMLRPWNKASLGHCVPDRCVPTLDRVKHGTSSIGLRRLMDQWGVWPASPTPLTRFIGLAPLRRMHARPTHRIKSKGWDGSVRGKIAKGHFVQGMQHPRIFGRGHIGRGWTNIAPPNQALPWFHGPVPSCRGRTNCVLCHQGLPAAAEPCGEKGHHLCWTSDPRASQVSPDATSMGRRHAEDHHRHHQCQLLHRVVSRSH